MSEPDNPRWLSEVGDELRRDVPVRARGGRDCSMTSPTRRRPSAGDDVDDAIRRTHSMSRSPRQPLDGVRSVLSPLAGLAAAALFVALGAGVMYAVISTRAKAADRAGRIRKRADHVRRGPDSARVERSDITDREVVRFELSAPRASRVALVGSFNEWNPVATPLVRDPSERQVDRVAPAAARSSRVRVRRRRRCHRRSRCPARRR